MFAPLIATLAALLLSATTLAQQPIEPNPARATFLEMAAEHMNEAEDHRLAPELAREKKEARERKERAIRADPVAFLPFVREALTLPKPEDLQVPTTREDRLSNAPEQHRKQLAACGAAYQVLALLPAEMRDPILCETFDKMLTRAIELYDRSQPEYAEWFRAGRPAKDEATVLTNNRRASWYYARAAGAITCAAAARDEVLIEPVFAHLASKNGGLSDASVAYLERFPQRYEEFIRRLNEILDSDNTLDLDRKYNIEKSIKRMQASRS